MKKLAALLLAVVLVLGLAACGGGGGGGGGARIEINESLSAFDALNFNVGVANITIRAGEAYHIEGHYPGALTYEVRGSTLHITSPTRRNQIGETQSGDLTITVPWGTAINATDLTLGVGNIYIQDLDLHSPSVTTGVGNVHMSGLFTGRANIESGVGDVSVEVAGPSDRFSYTIEAGVGSVTINGERQGGALGSSVSRTAADPLGTLQIQSGVGSVSLDFLERQTRS